MVFQRSIGPLVNYSAYEPRSAHVSCQGVVVFRNGNVRETK